MRALIQHIFECFICCKYALAHIFFIPDEILQAVPNVIAFFIIPMHFTTHIVLIFLEAIWTINIHDCIHGKLWSIMGAVYHTIHHTTYNITTNYSH